MPNQVITSVENNFTKGLVTEFTGLNFPENAATDTDNCVYEIVGDVTRREGFDYESGYTFNATNRVSNSVNSYKWNNAGGDGLTQVVVLQVGQTLYFYLSSSATSLAPLSTTKLASTVNITAFVASGASFDVTKECQFADGNGYLFVYHPNCDPFYCSYTTGTITATAITVQIRDFNGLPEPTQSLTNRPSTLTTEHQYNLVNQGWVKGTPWYGTSNTSVTVSVGSKVFTTALGMSVTNGDAVTIVATAGKSPGTSVMNGTVTGYVSGSGTLTINVTSIYGPESGNTYTSWIIQPVNVGYITAWNTAAGNYPSNADVWWYFKNSSGVFDPATTISNQTLNSTQAPQGHFLLKAFDQQRTLTSGIGGITPTTTPLRPKTGTWFQGRVWYTGIDASQAATGDAGAYTWTENIYFSQIVVNPTDFGNCFQANDPTSEKLFDLLPTDGGVIQIQGCGSIYKLFPIQNGMLVFASNGIWFITGSQGIGFAANDYTITKISSVQAISSTSYVDVNGLPYFWNEEGIYSVSPSKQGGLEVNPITVGTILSFYNSIPLTSKKYARGYYHPLDYIIQWVYRSTSDNDNVTSRYEFDRIMNFNTYNKAFFPYTIAGAGTETNPQINGIMYVSSPGGSTAPPASFKYITSAQSGATYNFTFAEERDTNYVDWASAGLSLDYKSYFVTGFKLHGQGQQRFQIPYLFVYSRSAIPNSYKIQGIWDYAANGDSGRWSTAELVNNWSPNFTNIYRRHRIRGQGLVLQIKLKSVSGKPFDIYGWSSFETKNTGV